MLIYTCELKYTAFQNGEFKNMSLSTTICRKLQKYPLIGRKSPHQAVLKEVSVFTTNLE